MKNNSVSEDIAYFISDSLQNNRHLRKWEKYHDQIKEALIERANGVYVCPPPLFFFPFLFFFHFNIPTYILHNYIGFVGSTVSLRP
jgi:hypothetical protein